jgi:hypothetical protein
VGKRELACLLSVLVVIAGAWYWNSWRKSESALASLRLRVNDLRGRVAKEVAKEVLGLLEHFQLDVLPLGTAGRLLMSGEVEEVLPLDDAKLLDEAKPIGPDGRFRLDSARLSARHDGQVQAALKDGTFALVILGGAHDLTQSVRRRAGGPCEYLRITTKCYREFAGEE